MKNLTKTAPVAAVALLLACGGVSAATVNITTSPGSLFNTAALAGFATTGSMMNGMLVTACDESSCETRAWETTGTGTGGVFGTGWSMTLAGDSFSVPFILTGSDDFAITSFSMNGRPGNTIFDIVNGDFLSPGSANGRPFTISGTSPFSGGVINVNYTDRLSVADIFYSDLFTVMNVNFGGATLTGTLSFITDTDNAATGSPIVPVSAPATLALAGLGLIGIAATRRRARQAG